jgi:tetraprenyl-beta-curcumene synthase
LPAAFARAAGRYWLSVFPLAARELRRRRGLALEVPDPVLRRLALRALECKRCNLEGAAAFELLARPNSSRSLIRTLIACQTICDYLDVLAEQPGCDDPVSNGSALHEALLVALAPGSGHRDYYAHHSHSDDGGYLRALVEDVQAGLSSLPALARVEPALRRSAERIAAYQSINHGDAGGSYAQFERWAALHASPGSGLSWWEAGGGAGSTLILFALISSATDRRLTPTAVEAIESAYFPWIGALHSLLDSLADQHEDSFSGERGLIGCYQSPERAATRMRAVAAEALRRAHRLSGARGHELLTIAMIGFYLCEARRLPRSAHARAVAPELLRTAGWLAHAAILMMGARHAVCRRSAARVSRLPWASDHAHAAHPHLRTCADPAVRVRR